LRRGMKLDAGGRARRAPHITFSIDYEARGL